jgi:hypothetical protein
VSSLRRTGAQKEPVRHKEDAFQTPRKLLLLAIGSILGTWVPSRLNPPLIDQHY